MCSPRQGKILNGCTRTFVSKNEWGVHLQGSYLKVVYSQGASGLGMYLDLALRCSTCWLSVITLVESMTPSHHKFPSAFPWWLPVIPPVFLQICIFLSVGLTTATWWLPIISSAPNLGPNFLCLQCLPTLTCTIPYSNLSIIASPRTRWRFA